MPERAPTSADPAGRLGVDARRQASRVLSILREELGMQLAYLTEFVGAQQVVRHVEGDAASLGLRPGVTVPLAGSYCQMVVRGELHGVVPDTAREPKVAALPVTQEAGLGAYVGVPLYREGGELYGTLCCASGHAQPELAARDTSFVKVLARVLGDAIAEDERRALLEEALAGREQDLAAANATLAASHHELARRLSMAVEFRDDATGAHVQRVGELSSALAAAAGVTRRECAMMAVAAPLHDVGKLAVPDRILLKPGPLTPGEQLIMRNHAQVGHDLLCGSVSPVLEMAATIALTHHERVDGGGYPNGLCGEAIPLEGRIVAIVDVHDALSSDRPYRSALSRPEIRSLLERGRGTHFDSWLLELFLEEVLPAGEGLR